MVNKQTYRLSAAVPLKSAHYLELLGREARRTGGSYLPKAIIVRALLNMAMRLDIDVGCISTQAELEERIWEAIVKKRPTSP